MHIQDDHIAAISRTGNVKCLLGDRRVVDEMDPDLGLFRKSLYAAKTEFLRNDWTVIIQQTDQIIQVAVGMFCWRQLIDKTGQGGFSAIYVICFHGIPETGAVNRLFIFPATWNKEDNQ